MKKIWLYSSLLFGALLVSGTTADAQVLSSQSGAGTTVTLAPSDPDSPSSVNVVFPPSPSVLLAVTSSENAYAITTMNASASDGDRNEYGIWSGNTGYYQNVNAATTPSTGLTLTDFGVDLAATTALTSTPFSAWTNMGGGGS
jgi:hypothetical protein